MSEDNNAPIGLGAVLYVGGTIAGLWYVYTTYSLLHAVLLSPFISIGALIGAFASTAILLLATVLFLALAMIPVLPFLGIGKLLS